MPNDLRQYQRHLTDRATIMVYVHDIGLLAKVDNISSSGLGIVCYRHLSDRRKKVVVDIFPEGLEGSSVLAVPCQITYDIEHLSEEESFSGSVCRIIGLEFESLSEHQLKSIEALVQQAAEVR